MGSVPEWYPYFRAAQYLGCTPWELMEQPLCYLDWALIALQAENAARQGPRKVEAASAADLLR